jgi:hypothetical protein
MSQQDKKISSPENLNQKITLLGQKMKNQFIKVARENKLKKQKNKHKHKQTFGNADFSLQDTSFASLQLPNPKGKGDMDEKMFLSFSKKKNKECIYEVRNMRVEQSVNQNVESNNPTSRNLERKECVLGSLLVEVENKHGSSCRKGNDENSKILDHDIKLKNKNQITKKYKMEDEERNLENLEKKKSKSRNIYIRSQKTPKIDSSVCLKDSHIKCPDGKSHNNEDVIKDKVMNVKNPETSIKEQESKKSKKTKKNDLSEKNIKSKQKNKNADNLKKKSTLISSPSSLEKEKERIKLEIDEINREIQKENQRLHAMELENLKSKKKKTNYIPKTNKLKNPIAQNFLQNGLVSEQTNSNQMIQQGSLIQNDPAQRNPKFQENCPKIRKDFVRKQERKYDKNNFKPITNNQNAILQNPQEPRMTNSNSNSILNRRCFEYFQNQENQMTDLERKTQWFQLQISKYNDFMNEMILKNQHFAKEMDNFIQRNYNIGPNPLNIHPNLNFNAGAHQYQRFFNANPLANNFNTTIPFPKNPNKIPMNPYNDQIRFNKQQTLENKNKKDISLVSKKKRNQFEKLGKLLKKIFLMGNITKQDLELNFVEKWTFEKIIEKKKYYLICGIVWKEVDFFNKLKTSTTQKRNEEKIKYVFKITQKKLKKKFSEHYSNYCIECKDEYIKNILEKDKNYAFFHYYFASYCKEKNIPLEKIIQASSYENTDSNSSRKKNTKAIKTVNRQYFEFVKENPKFMDEFKNYILFDCEDLTKEEDTEDNIIGDSRIAIKKKIEKKIMEWSAIWCQLDNNFEEFKQFINNDFKKKKYKLPWTMIDVYSAVDEIKQIIREEAPNYQPEKFD